MFSLATPGFASPTIPACPKKFFKPVEMSTQYTNQQSGTTRHYWKTNDVCIVLAQGRKNARRSEEMRFLHSSFFSAGGSGKCGWHHSGEMREQGGGEHLAGDIFGEWAEPWATNLQEGCRYGDCAATRTCYCRFAMLSHCNKALPMSCELNKGFLFFELWLDD